MILSCPACHTTFMVSDAAFGTKPRRVRCSRCQHEWQAEPPAPPEAPIIFTPPPVAPKPIPAGSNVPAPRATPSLWEQHGSKAITFAGAVLCLYLFVSILGSAGVDLSLSALMAPAETGKSLALEDVKTRYDAQSTAIAGEQQFALVVEGLVRNVGTEPAPVPPIVIEIKDKAGKIVASQTASLQTQTLPPGQGGSFLQTFDNPPDDIADITVAFHTNVSDNSHDKNKDTDDIQHE